MKGMKHSLLAMGLAGIALPTGATILAAQPASHRNVSGTFKGPSTGMQYGPVQVTIIVKNSKIINVKATAPHHTSRSALINSVALPILRKEVLKAQSAKIQTVSGATLTSHAYVSSLKGALASAKL